MGALGEDAHALNKKRVMKGGAKQALLPSKIRHERGEALLEERHLESAPKIQNKQILIVVSDEEEDVRAAAGGSNSGVEMVNMPMIVQEDRMLQFTPREVQSKKGSKEEEWELAHKPKVPTTIENLTYAFLIYTRVTRNSPDACEEKAGVPSSSEVSAEEKERLPQEREAGEPNVLQNVRFSRDSATRALG
ncbi:hypothetical protein NDU88_004147 [Pleurodeles waltl]|uniref:Uncharacterized protein n=1 Tax=Pleurodeles waltl TaxID=8319 RepID=A0AAV7MD67_PLEWA|nr:hypothetical protein NDU88_004147 [Pleurodeles waltl]